MEIINSVQVIDARQTRPSLLPEGVATPDYNTIIPELEASGQYESYIHNFNTKLQGYTYRYIYLESANIDR